jgi:subtilisin family serine protease
MMERSKGRLYTAQVALWLASLSVPGWAIASEVVVAVIDTGIDSRHPALAPYLWVNALEANGEPGVDDDGNGYVDDVHGFNFVDRTGRPDHVTANDHGTHVSGLVLRGFSGAPIDLKLMIINVYGHSFFASPIEALDEGIRYAVRMGAQVLNLSVTSRGDSPSTALALREAHDSGVLVVAAAGNEALDLDSVPSFPAGYSQQIPSLITVAAVDAETGVLCQSSSFGVSTVWLAAPGCDERAPRKGIYSTRSGGRFGYKSGTSMAAPFVTGGLATWLSNTRNAGARPGERARRWLAERIRPSRPLEGRIALPGVYGAPGLSWDETEVRLRELSVSVSAE